MKVIEIPADDFRIGVVRAQADDIVVFRGVGYRVIVSEKGEACSLCDCCSKEGCECPPFNCYSDDEYPYGLHLVCVCPEEGGEE